MERNHFCIVCGQKFPERELHFKYIKHKGFRRIKKGMWTCGGCWNPAGATAAPEAG